MTFPANPVNNQTVIINDTVYQYDAISDSCTRIRSTAADIGRSKNIWMINGTSTAMIGLDILVLK